MHSHGHAPQPRRALSVERRRRRTAPLLVVIAVVAVAATLVAFTMVRQPIPTDDGRVLLNESFAGDRLDSSVWTTCHWWADQGCTIASNDELEWYLPQQVSVADDTLRLTAVAEEAEGSDGETYDFRSGMVTTGPEFDGAEPKLAFTYGTVEARLRVPAGRGLWSAMWLLPADQESRPEIDVLEVLGHEPAEMIMHLHPADRRATSPSKHHRLPRPGLAEGWHTIRLNWSPGRLVFSADGVKVWQVTGRQVPAEPMYLVFNLAVGGVYPGSPDAETRFPATFAIDYVRVEAAV